MSERIQCDAALCLREPYRSNMLLIPLRIPIVEHYGHWEEDIEAKFEDFEVQASHVCGNKRGHVRRRSPGSETFERF